MTRASWVELCVSNFEQSITWFENVLGFHVTARDANEYVELSRDETFIQLAADDAPYWETERSHLLSPGQRGSGVEIVLLVENIDLEKEMLDDEAYLRICRETGRTSDLVDRLLNLGRIDEAMKETRRVDDLAFLGLADLFIQHEQDTIAEHLVKTRIQEKPALHFLEWLQKYYGDRGNFGAELEMAEMSFRAQPLLNRYREIRNLAGKLNRWEMLRPNLLAFVEQGKNLSVGSSISLSLEKLLFACDASR